MFLISCLRKQDQNAFLLFNARQKEQIRIGLHWQRAISIGRENIICIHHRQSPGGHQVTDAFAVLNEKLGFYGLVSHGETGFRVRERSGCGNGFSVRPKGLKILPDDFLERGWLGKTQ